MRLIIPIFLNLMMIDYAIGAGPEIPWTAKMKRDVLSIYYRTFPADSTHAERMKEKWDWMYSQYKDSISSEELRQYAINLIEKISHYHDEDKSFLWTPELNKVVLEIFHQTRGRRTFLEGKMRKLWNVELPYYNADTRNLNLHDRALKLLRALNELEGDKKRKLLWSSSMNEDLIKIHSEVPKNETRRTDKMKKLFDSRFPQLKDKVSDKAVYQHALYLVNNEGRHRKKVHKPKERSIWNDKLYAEIIHIYHQTDPSGWSHERKMQYCWSKMHPELKNATPVRLRRATQHLLAKNYKPVKEHEEEAKMKFNEAFPQGFNYKGKEIMLDEDQPSTSARQPEQDINQSYSEDSTDSPIRR